MSQTIKGYLVEEQIGEGGFGVVYRARQSSAFDREVAIKVILPRYANEPDFIRHFESEAQTVSRLEHPHIVPLYDYWRNPDGAYLVMRWLRGGSLKEMIKQQPLNPEKADAILQQICNGLATAHQLGVIHRDIKPSNILMDEYGNAYLADFGIAKDLSKGGGNTKQDTIKGSLGYISPEQACNETVTPRSDVYSLGVTLFEMLAGQHPFHDFNEIEKLYKHLNDPLPPISNLDPAIEAQVNEVVQQATAKDPAQRYADALAFARAFREAAQIDSADPANIVLSLTQREHEILHLLSEGKSNKEIANELFITVSTVRWHLRQAYKKLNVRSRIEAIIKIKELDLIVPGSTSADDDGDLSHYTYIADLPNPYKGLKAFSAADTNDFFGREAFVETLLEKMNANQQFKRFLAIVGPSGSGKSSLVRAGLIPAIWRNGIPGSESWYTVELIPGSNPLAELETALIRVAADQGQNIMAQLQRDDGGLVRVGQLILPDDDSELLVVIDQFEEIFTLVEDENEREHFLNLIVKAVTEPRSRVRAVITLRADFFDRPLQYPQFGEMLRQRMETVMPLSAEELERAIVEPAKRLQVAFDDGLVASIISDIHYQPGALPLLQYALSELFDRRESMVITRAAYEDIGGTTGALANQADDLYHDLTPEAKALVQQMFMRLVTLGEGTEDTRRRVSREELAALTDNIDLLDDIINIFVEKRLLATDHDPATRTPTVEVAHEALIREWETMRGWLYDSRDDIKLQRRLNNAASMWQEHGHEASFLISGNRLQQFEQWAAQSSLTLTDTEQAFLDASIAQRVGREAKEQAQIEREANLQLRARRVLQGLVAVFLIAAVVGGGLAIFAFGERARAIQAQQDAEEKEKEARSAASQAEAARALDLLEEGFQDQAVDSALLAIEFADTPDAVSALADVVEAYHPYQTFEFDFGTAKKDAIALSNDGTKLYNRGIVDLNTGQLVELPISIPDYETCPEMFYRADWSPDDRFILVWLNDFLGVDETCFLDPFIVDANSYEIVSELSGRESIITWADWSSDGQMIATADKTGNVTLWNPDDSSIIDAQEITDEPIIQVSWSPVDGHVAALSESGKLTIWDPSSPTEQIGIQAGLKAVNSFIWSPDGNQIAAVGEDAIVRIWNSLTGELQQVLVGGVDGLAIVKWSPDGNKIAANAQNGTVYIWDAFTGDLLTTIKLSGTLSDFVWSKNSQKIIAGDGNVRFYDVSSSSSSPINLPPEAWGTFTTAWSPSGEYILTTSFDGMARIWDANTYGLISETGSPGSRIMWSAWSPDSTKVVLSNGNQSVVRVWDFATNENIFEETLDEAFFTSGASFSPDGSRFAVNTFDSSGSDIHHRVPLYIWELATGDLLTTIVYENEDCFLWNPSWSPDGTKIVTSCSSFLDPNDTLPALIWDTTTGELLHEFKEDSIVWRTQWSPDGTRIAIGYQNGTAKVWDSSSETVILPQELGSTPIYVAWSGDSKFIASGDREGNVKVWNAETGAYIYSFTVPAFVQEVNWSPDDTHLIIGGGFEPIIKRVWTSKEELIEYAYDCCVRDRELTNEERALYGLPPHE